MLLDPISFSVGGVDHSASQVCKIIELSLFVGSGACSTACVLPEGDRLGAMDGYRMTICISLKVVESGHMLSGS
jgi:hypothetical protein